MFLDVAGNGGNETGNATLHVHRTTSEHFAARNFSGKGRMAPCRLVAYRNDIGMARKHQVRTFRAKPGVEVFHVRRSRFRRHHLFHRKAKR